MAEKNTLLDAAEKEIKRLEREVEKLNEKLEETETQLSKSRQTSRDVQDRLYALKTEYGADYGGDGMFKNINEALKVQTEMNRQLMAENKELHARCDAAFAGVKIDASSKKHMLQAITERLDGIKASVDALMEE